MRSHTAVDDAAGLWLFGSQCFWEIGIIRDHQHHSCRLVAARLLFSPLCKPFFTTPHNQDLRRIQMLLQHHQQCAMRMRQLSHASPG